MKREPTPSPLFSGSLQRKAFSLVQLLVTLGLFAIGVALLLPATRRSTPAAHRNTCSTNLKQIVYALRSYESVYHALPPAYTVDDSGKPLHSWRTLILPYLELDSLYASIDLSKPWNDEANAEAFNAQLQLFRCPAANVPPSHTTYLAVVTPNSCLRPGQPRPLADVSDGEGKTMMVVDVAPSQAVHWMCPTDADEATILGIQDTDHLPHPNGVNAAFVDGSVHFLPTKLIAEHGRALISIAGNDPVGAGDY